jgi:small-conductance mechanosensitive channel
MRSRLLLAALLAAASAPALAASGAPAASTAAVTLGGREVFVVAAPLANLTAAERAGLIASRLEKAAAAGAAAEDMRVRRGRAGDDLLAGNLLLTTVTDDDARAAGLSRPALADRELALVRDALRLRHRTRSLRAIAREIGLTVLAVAALALLIGLAGRLFPLLRDVLEKEGLRFIPSLRVQSLELLPARRLHAVLLDVVGALHAVTVLLFVYVFLSFVLSLYPGTQSLAGRLYGYVMAPVSALTAAALAYLPKLIFIAVTLAAVRYLLKLVRLIFTEIENGGLYFPGFYREWAEPTWQIARALIVVFTIIAIFPYLPGAGSPAFRGISVFVGVLLSLGSSSAIANSVAGIIMTYMRPFSPGDRVQISDTVGDVVDRSMLVTRVRTIKNVEVTIPNAMVLGAHILNFTAGARSGGLILHDTVTIGYDAPWRKVHALLIAAAKKTEGLRAEPEPFVLQTGLGDYAVSYEINARCDLPNEMAVIQSRLRASIQDEFAAAGVEIMSPRFYVRRTGPDSTVPRADGAARA